MKIKCLSNILQVIEHHQVTSSFDGKTNDEFVVYAIAHIDGLVHYYIDCGGKLMCVPCPMFDVIDQRLPRCWIFNFNDGKFPIWSFPEWADNPSFYDEVLNGNNEAIQKFKFYKEKMDAEAITG